MCGPLPASQLQRRAVRLRPDTVECKLATNMGGRWREGQQPAGRYDYVSKLKWCGLDSQAQQQQEQQVPWPWLCHGVAGVRLSQLCAPPPQHCTPHRLHLSAACWSSAVAPCGPLGVLRTMYTTTMCTVLPLVMDINKHGSKLPKPVATTHAHVLTFPTPFPRTQPTRGTTRIPSPSAQATLLPSHHQLPPTFGNAPSIRCLPSTTRSTCTYGACRCAAAHVLIRACCVTVCVLSRRLGGRDKFEAYNDVYVSKTGLDWTKLSDAPWSARAEFGATVWQGRMWVVGGASFSSQALSGATLVVLCLPSQHHLT